MISCEGLATKHVVVLGLGKSGLAAARALCRSGARVLVWDDNEASRNAAKAEALPVREPERINWAAMDALVISPGIAHTYPKPHPAARMAKDAGVPIIGDMELLATSGANAPFAAITGTNGKSTTTALLGHVMEEAGRDVEVGGNLGPAICDMAMMEHDGLYVLELSSYQLELCPSARFKVAVLLNVTPDHIDRHGDMGGYVHAKKNIFHNQGSGDAAIIGVDTAVMREIYEEQKKRNGRKVLPIATQAPAPGGVYVADGNLIDDIDGQARTVMTLSDAPNLPGIHNAQNIAAAYASARMLGVDAADIVQGIKSFPGLAHRQEVVAHFTGVTYVNDSKATNAEATAKALACYDDIFWIVGGRAKEGGLDGLELLYSHVRRAFLIGEAANDFAKQLDGKVAYEHCGDLDTATHRAREAALASGCASPTVLLSPACASFDQFNNFEHRGDTFRDIVEAMRVDHPGGHVHLAKSAEGLSS
ncbi:MAG: UDP-N-acetylmuramoyl-L-alanine--D-glutamate ligase [Rhodospirillales bacterium]|nr:UDP-N-acetylmuramoyl-L-alanine--D-glutamate ligase [Rhodospirillales bacterium]